MALGLVVRCCSGMASVHSTDDCVRQVRQEAAGVHVTAACQVTAFRGQRQLAVRQ
jgi:hypothetical protein